MRLASIDRNPGSLNNNEPGLQEDSIIEEGQLPGDLASENGNTSTIHSLFQPSEEVPYATTTKQLVE